MENESLYTIIDCDESVATTIRPTIGPRALRDFRPKTSNSHLSLTLTPQPIKIEQLRKRMFAGVSFN